MDPQSAKAFLNSPSLDVTNNPASLLSTNSATTNNPADSLLVPFLQQQQRKSSANPIEVATERREKTYQQENQTPGLPLDTETGGSPWDRFMVGWAKQKKDQLDYLQNKYGQDNVRLDTEGDFVFRVKDPDTDKAKDIKVHPRSMSVGDFMDVAAAAPELIGSLLAIRAGRGIPKVGAAGGVLGLGRDVLAGAAGAEGTGIAKDISTGLALRGDADIGDIVKERGKQAAVDVGLGAATMGVGRLLKFMGAPLTGSRGPVQFDALSAQKYFKDKYGVEVPLTVAESTGSHLAGRTEAYVEMQPAGSGPFAALKQRQENTLRQLQDIMMGSKVPDTDRTLGEKLIAHLESKVAPLESAAQTSAADLAKSGTGQIERIATGLTTPERQLLLSKTGQEVRDAVVSARDAAKGQADTLYAAVESAPGGTGRVLDGTELQNRLRAIVKQLPGVESEKTVSTGLLGPTGKPITSTAKINELLEKSAPDKLLGRIREILEKQNPQFSLSDLQQLRRDIYDDISRGEGVPGLGVHYLGDFANAVTQTIEGEVSKMPAGTLKSALEAANKFYKEKVVPFNRTGLTELFRRADEPGFLPNDQIVAQIFGGGKALNNYSVLKETLGATSPTFVKLKRAVLDQLIEQGRTPGGDLLDAQSLMNAFVNFQKGNREIANDIFGSKLGQIIKEANYIDYAAGGKIAEKDLAALLSSPSPTAAKLRDLVTKQRTLDDAYRNSILREVSKNKVPEKAIVPEEFVSRFVDNPKVGASDINKVLDLLKGTPLIDDLRAKTVEQLFRNAGRRATAMDINRLMAGDPTRIVTGTGVFQQIENPAMKEKVQAILGPDIYKDLENYIKLEASTEAKYAAGGYKMAGSFAASQKVGELERGKFGKYFKGSALNYLVANFITRAPFRQWLSAMPKDDQPQYVSLLLSSPVFLQTVAKDFPGVPGMALVKSLKDSLDRWVRDESASKPPAQDASGGTERRQLMQDYLNGRTKALP